METFKQQIQQDEREHASLVRAKKEQLFQLLTRKRAGTEAPPIPLHTPAYFLDSHSGEAASEYADDEGAVAHVTTHSAMQMPPMAMGSSFLYGTGTSTASGAGYTALTHGYAPSNGLRLYAGGGGYNLASVLQPGYGLGSADTALRLDGYRGVATDTRVTTSVSG